MVSGAEVGMKIEETGRVKSLNREFNVLMLQFEMIGRTGVEYASSRVRILYLSSEAIIG